MPVPSALAPETSLPTVNPNGDTYLIGPGDDLNIFVWRNLDLSTHIPVRPDGKISIPLVEDVTRDRQDADDARARGRGQAARLRQRPDRHRYRLAIRRSVRAAGARDRRQRRSPGPSLIAATCRCSTSWIEVGGLTALLAAGDRSMLVRNVNGKSESMKAHLDELVKDGDVKEQRRDAARRHSDYSAALLLRPYRDNRLV